MRGAAATGGFRRVVGPMSGVGAAIIARAESGTLGACKSTNEWLSAAQNLLVGPSADVAGAGKNVNLFTILQRFCDGNRRDKGIPGLPVRAPACNGVLRSR